MKHRRRRIDAIDLSNHQSDLKINWHEAKRAGVKFVHHKATEGTTYQDPLYPPRRREVNDHGLPFGAYHFAHPDRHNAKAEALYFLNYADPANGDMLPVLDLEVNDHHMSEDELADWVAEWFSVVFEHTRQHRGILYTRYPISRKPKGVFLWVARYNNDNRAPEVPHPFWTWTMWQFSDGQFGNPASVPGVGHCDISTLHRKFGFVRVNRLRLHTKADKGRGRGHAHFDGVATGQAPKKRKRREPPIERAVRIAKSQIGYHEGRSGGHWNNIQKFSRLVKPLNWSQGQPWCCTFVSWVAQKADLAAYYPCTASVAAAEAWWKAKNQWSEYPAIGAQAIFGNGAHTGFVVGYDDTYVYTVEGNTNTNGSAEGDGVYLKKRLRTDPYVSGYGYPEIPGVRLKTADPNYYAGRRAA